MNIGIYSSHSNNNLEKSAFSSESVGISELTSIETFVTTVAQAIQGDF